MDTNDPFTSKPSLKLFTNAKFSRKELIVIFSLCVTLSIGIVSKYAIDYHWNTPDVEVIQSQSGLDPSPPPPPQGGRVRVGVRFQLDINKAEWYELVLLPEVGEVRAKAMVAYREKYGEFRDIKELLNVKGMNGSVIEAIREYVTIAECGVQNAE